MSKPKSFHEYKLLRESEESNLESNAVGSKVSLGDNSQFHPFYISDDPKSENYGKNKNLAPIVRAFKSGANWGWSRDNDTGKDKPVKISSKRLFLSGGAVRDHLLGKKTRNIELTTNASPDEVFHILKQNGFSFISKEGNLKGSNNSPNKKHGNNQTFWVNKVDSNKRPFCFGISVNDDHYELDVFRKNPRGLLDSNMESGSQIDDASGRDFTINGMYILLNNDNGPNKELLDFFGGMHHLAARKISSIGDMQSKFEEDPSRIIRYARMMNSYGSPDKVSDEEKDLIKSLSDRLNKLDNKVSMSEFNKGMEREDIDSRRYIKSCNDLGILDKIFPGKIIDSKLPVSASEVGDRHMPLAFMLRLNSPNSLNDLNIEPRDLQKIIFLIKMLGLNSNISPQNLSDLTTNYLSSGMPSRKLRDFVIKFGGMHSDLIDGFIDYTKKPRVKVFIKKDGIDTVADEFQDLVDPFDTNIDPDAFENRKKEIELNNFIDQLKNRNYEL